MGEIEREEDPKTQNDISFIPDIVHFLIRVILRFRMNHFHISPTAPSYIMHIWTYIYKYAGCGRFTLGLGKKIVEEKPINAYQVYSISYF